MQEVKRNNSQNRLMWAILNDISRQLEWPVNGKMQRLSAEDFKHILSAGFVKEQRVAAGIDGGFVILGQHTSKMTKEQMTQFIEFIIWFCADRGVKITAPEYYEEYAGG